MITVGVAALAQRPAGVYWAQTDLVFLAPTTPEFPNSLNTSSESVIMTAGVVKDAVDLGDKLEATSSATITLVDNGVRDGSLVRLPNLGGQWANNYAHAVLDIQAVAGTPAEVERRMAAIQRAIETDLQRRQDDAGVYEEDRISNTTVAERH